MKKISCRDHQGGVFTVVTKRGRPPVRCTESNPCTMANKPVRPNNRVVTRENTYSAAEKSASVKPTRRELAERREEFAATDIHQMTLAQLKAYARKHFSTISKLNTRPQLIGAIERQLEKQAAQQTETVAKDAVKALARFKPTPEAVTSNGRAKSLELAQKAKAQLVSVGWDVQGSAKGEVVTIAATRGDEILAMSWKDGVAFDSSYSLWSVDKPSSNGDVPAHELPFDPEWATDGEIAAHIVGMKITWWNRISGKEERGVCGHDTISIEHRFDGAGHEIPSERLIKFIDGAGGKMRLIQLGQLLKVGK